MFAGAMEIINKSLSLYLHPMPMLTLSTRLDPADCLAATPQPTPPCQVKHWGHLIHLIDSSALGLSFYPCRNNSKY